MAFSKVLKNIGIIKECRRLKFILNLKTIFAKILGFKKQLHQKTNLAQYSAKKPKILFPFLQKHLAIEAKIDPLTLTLS